MNRLRRLLQQVAGWGCGIWIWIRHHGRGIKPPCWISSILGHAATWTMPHPSHDDEEEDEEDVLVARGTGGRLELNGNCLRLTKGGTFGFFLALLGVEGGFVERTIRVSDIAAVEMDKPALFFRYMRFSYPGAPDLTGDDLKDMMAENALLMSLFDNRGLYRIKERIERSMNQQVGR